MEVLQIFLIVAGAVLALYVWYIVALRFATIAETKGYNGRPYFWFTFLLGIIGMLMVIALPYDKVFSDTSTTAKG